MSELVVVGFKNDIGRAAAVLSELRERDEAWAANLHGAIAAYRTAAGELTIDQSYEATKGEGSIVGGMLGSLVGIALAALALPLTAGAGTAVIGASLLAGAVGGTVVGAHRHREHDEWWQAEVGISDDFLREVGARIQPGDSAIVLLLREPDPSDLAARFRPYNGTVARYTLTAAQTAALNARLARKS